MLGGLPQKKGYWREEVAELLRIDEDTVTKYTKKFDESGLEVLLEENYHPPKSQLEPYTEQLKELFKKQLVNQAYDPIRCEAITITNDTYINLTRTFSPNSSKKLLTPTLIAGVPLLWYWIMPDIKNVSQSPTRQKN